MKVKWPNIFLLLLFFAAKTIFGQDYKPSTQTEIINGKKYILHKVEKGQSMYAIAKLYNIELNQLLVENPDAIDGLKTGEILRIPAFPAEKPKEVSDGRKFQTHVVQKGETMYGITRKYNITESALLTLNPDASKGLKEGMTLRIKEEIPVRQIDPVRTETVVPVNSNRDTVYVVQKGETLYSISKKLNTTVADLIKLNPGIENGIQDGQPIVFRKVSEKSDYVQTSDTIPLNSQRKEKYKLAVFLPFHFDDLNSFNPDEAALAKQTFPAIPQIAIDFFEGFKLAADSIADNQCKFDFSLIDMDERDTGKAEKVVQNENLSGYDLLIGPLHTSNFRIISRHAKSKSIPVVAPFLQQNKVLFDNPYASKVTPGNFNLIEGLASFIADSFRNENVVVIRHNVGKDLPMIKAFRQAYSEKLRTMGVSPDTVPEVIGIAGAKLRYLPGKKNIYVVLTESEVFVSDFLTQLNVFADKKENITVCGLKRWLTFENLDFQYLNRFGFICASSFFVDFEQSHVREISLSYQRKFNSDPGDYYYLGYDLGLYYLSQLRNNGTGFYQQLDLLRGKGYVMDFNFFRPNAQTGFDNRSIRILQYKDYKSQRLR